MVELELGIAGLTYGGLLGAFLLGLFVRRARQTDALIAFVITIASMVFVVFGTPIAYPLYTVIGVAIMLLVGGLLSLRHSSPAPTAGGERPESRMS